MSKFLQEYWVTCALQAWAWVLATSLKKCAYSNRKLTAIVGRNVAAAFVHILRQEFDLVIEEPKWEELVAVCGADNWPRGWEQRVGARLWAWTLKIWKKCVHIPANS